MPEQPPALCDARDRLLSEWRAAYDAVPEDRAVAVGELHVPGWWRGRGQLAHALRRMKDMGLLTGGHGKFQRVKIDG
jgi:hypothetical protein